MKDLSLKDSCHFRKIENGEAIPFDLLLLADETKEAIEKYIHRSDIYIVNINDIPYPIGVFALYKIDSKQIEIKNIAVKANHQGNGIGGLMLEEIKSIAYANWFEEIIVGTADTGIKEIAFYEKNGFEKYGVRKNFFVKNYPEPILENGVRLRDMVMLKFQIL